MGVIGFLLMAMTIPSWVISKMVSQIKDPKIKNPSEAGVILDTSSESPSVSCKTDSVYCVVCYEKKYKVVCQKFRLEDL